MIKTNSRTLRAALMAATVAASLGACATGDRMAGMAGPSPQGQPGIPFSGVRPDADNQAVLDALMALNLRPYHTLTPVEA